MLLESVVLLIGITGTFGTDCTADTCLPSQTCCTGTNSLDATCCPYANGVCCEDGMHCCPEGSFCDMEIRMCATGTDGHFIQKRVGHHGEEEIVFDLDDERHTEKHDPSQVNEISHLRTMLVHCDLNQFCPETNTCCRRKADNVSLCCSYREGVCCPDDQHCCRQGEECDSQSLFCLRDVGMETEVRRARVMDRHYVKRGLDLFEEILAEVKIPSKEE